MKKKSQNCSYYIHSIYVCYKEMKKINTVCFFFRLFAAECVFPWFVDHTSRKPAEIITVRWCTVSQRPPRYCMCTCLCVYVTTFQTITAFHVSAYITSQWGPLVYSLAAFWHAGYVPTGAACLTRCCLQGLKETQDVNPSTVFFGFLLFDCAGLSCEGDWCVWNNRLCSTFMTLQLSCIPPSLHAYNGTSGPGLERLGVRGCTENPKHYSFMAVMSLFATAMLVQVSHLTKLGLMMLVATANGAVNIYSWQDIYDLYDIVQFGSYRWEQHLLDMQNLIVKMLLCIQNICSFCLFFQELPSCHPNTLWQWWL